MTNDNETSEGHPNSLAMIKYWKFSVAYEKLCVLCDAIVSKVL